MALDVLAQVRAEVARQTTRSAKLAVIEEKLAEVLTKAVGETCLVVTMSAVNDSLLTEWETEASARKCAAIAPSLKRSAEVFHDEDLGWMCHLQPLPENNARGLP
jgi:hypothetical protein